MATERKVSLIYQHGQATFREVTASAYAYANATDDRALFELAEELSAAEHILQAARTELAGAERKLQRTVLFPGEEFPAWFVAREEAEAAAGAVVDSLCEEIAAAPARSRAGMAIKLRVLAALFQGDPTPIEKDGGQDVVQALLQSMDCKL